MDGAWLARMRWRRRGAWLWPAFLASLVLDAALGHLLPPAGQSQRVVGAALLGAFLNLLGIVLLSRPLGMLIRRRHAHLPAIVASDYGGTMAIAAVTAGLLLAGLVHRHTLSVQQAAKRDAIVRAQAYIGDRAPVEFREHLAVVDTYAIEPGSMYRVCVPSARRPMDYCVVVKTKLPFAQSVTFDGHESNGTFGAGTG